MLRSPWFQPCMEFIAEFVAKVEKAKDRGDRLLEVIISTVIMGIIGVLLVSSIAVARPFADKMSLVGETVQTLNSLAESINLQPFQPCSTKNSEPYAFAKPVSSPVSNSSTFGISNSDLPPVMVSTATKSNPYSAHLLAHGAPGPVTWQVEPLLPSGLSLDPNTGVISGTTSQPITATYDFTATSGSSKDIKSLLLTSALVNILENDGSAWVPCENIPVDSLTGIVGDGTQATYRYTGPAITKGSTVAVWGTGNKSFEGASLQVADATTDTFTVLNPTVASSNSGFASFSSSVAVQQVVVSTVVSGSPVHKVIAKAMS